MAIQNDPGHFVKMTKRIFASEVPVPGNVGPTLADELRKPLAPIRGIMQLMTGSALESPIATKGGA